MPNAQQRMDILLRLERGEISPAEAERLLNAANAPAPASTPRMGLLEQVERGELSADEAIQHLLSTPTAAQPPAEEALELAPRPAPRRAGWPRLGFGLLLIIASAWWMRSSLLLHGGLSLGFLCLWLPFAAGLGLLGPGRGRPQATRGAAHPAFTQSRPTARSFAAAAGSRVARRAGHFTPHPARGQARFGRLRRTAWLATKNASRSCK
ncbi:MAG: hypothetical protein KF828_03340 [Anaerolineales bacterium]|nr:hypothetical protein [Anaerolineales bacterium]